MTKRTRLTILLSCVVCFVVVAPYIVLYSMGYRVDFETMKIAATGGIYVRTFPTADQIIIDSKINKTPALFANSVFVQSLLPKNHTVYVEKDGYYEYNKTLLVKEKEVTKLENVLLFRNDIKFETVIDGTKSPFTPSEKFLIKNNNLYYSNIPENSKITNAQKLVPVLKNLVAFTLQDNNVVWMGTDGFLYKSGSTDFSDDPIKLNLTPLKVNKKGVYKITTDGQNTFVNDSGTLLLFNSHTNNLDTFAQSVKDVKISPDGKNVIYFINQEIYISLLSDASNKKTLLYSSPKNIIDCVWLNNDYIIFNTDNQITISEIDYRGSTNVVNLSQASDKIFFNHQDNKLYILNKNILLSSDKLTP